MLDLSRSGRALNALVTFGNESYRGQMTHYLHVIYGKPPTARENWFAAWRAARVGTDVSLFNSKAYYPLAKRLLASRAETC